MLLKGRTALITGGNSGIGLATARRFVAEGARAAITGRDAATLAAAGRALMGIGVGLAASPSTAAILEFASPERAKSAASVTMGRRQLASPRLCCSAAP
jgi:NAD(P)-dependent dehydrogenase (short-subunit alcohol dehydrogenase family)